MEFRFGCVGFPTSSRQLCERGHPSLKSGPDGSGLKDDVHLKFIYVEVALTPITPVPYPFRTCLVPAHLCVPSCRA